MSATSTVFELSIDPHLTVDLAYQVTNGVVQHARVVASGSTDATGKATFELGANAVGGVTCIAPLARLVIPVTGPLSLVLAPIIPFSVVGELQAKVSAASVGVGGQFQVTSTTNLGFDYTPASGLVGIHDATNDGEITRVLTVAPQSGVRVDATVFAGVGSGLNIGNVLFSEAIVDLNIGGEIETKLGDPFDVANDPIFQAGYELKRKAQISPGDDIDALLQRLGLELEHLDMTSKLETVIASSPNASTLTVDKGAFNAGDALSFHVVLDPARVAFPGTGYNVDEVRIYQLSYGTSSATPIATQRAASGQTDFLIPWSASFSGSAQTAGAPTFYAFVVDKNLNAVTSAWPFELGRMQAGDFTIAPTTVTLAPGATQTFVVTRDGEVANGGYTFTFTGGTMNAAVYTAGTTSGAYTVTATNDDNGATAIANITISSLALTPATTTVAFGTTRQFTATYAGEPLTNPVWTASGGSISDTGLFTAGNTAGVFNVVVTSTDHVGESMSAVVTVVEPCARIGNEKYCVITLPRLGTNRFYGGLVPAVINDAGVVGATTQDENGNTFVVSYAGGALTDLSRLYEPGDYVSGAIYDINANGEMAGQIVKIDADTGQYAYILPAIFSSSGVTIATLPPGCARANLISLSNNGDYFGYGTPGSGPDLPFLWWSGNPQQVEAFDTYNGEIHLNNGGDYLHYSSHVDAGGAVFTTHLVLADGSTKTIQPNSRLQPTDITDNRHILFGQSLADNFSCWSYDDATGAATLLPTPSGWGCLPIAINDSGVVIASITRDDVGSRAAVLYNGTLTELNSLLPPGYITSQVTAINNAGEIVGNGAYTPPGGQPENIAFILRPIPD